MRSDLIRSSLCATELLFHLRLLYLSSLLSVRCLLWDLSLWTTNEMLPEQCFQGHNFTFAICRMALERLLELRHTRGTRHLPRFPLLSPRTPVDIMENAEITEQIP